MPPPAPGPRRSLSARLLWITVCVVLFAELLVFIPALTHERHDWLDRRVTEAQFAALSAATAPDGMIDANTRDALLRLSGTAAIRLQEPGRDRILLAPDGVMPSARPLDLDDETLPEAMYRSLAALGARDESLVAVISRSPLQPAAAITLVLHESRMADDLVRFATVFGLVSLAVALLVGWLVYFSLLVLLVRPMSHITGSIRAFRADPEYTPPLIAAETMPLRDDEMAVAARELGAMQRELRTALWRNARLAAIGTAVAKVSHDLRGILSPAMLAAERLQMSEDPAVTRAGDILVRAVERATELMSGTLEFAREVPVVPERVRCALPPVIAEAADQVRLGSALRVDIVCPDDLEIDADRTHLLRVFANLLRNAAEAQARLARVTAEVAPTGILIVVADDGAGLPDSVRANLFRPFVTGGRRGSTGLGLAIVRDLVRAHGGTIELQETGPAGTIFRITLPAASLRRAPRPTTPVLTGSPIEAAGGARPPAT